MAGWYHVIGQQAQNIRSQIPSKFTNMDLMSRIKRAYHDAMGSKVGGLAMQLMGSPASRVMGLLQPKTFGGQLKALGALAGTGAAILSGKGAVAAAPLAVKKLQDLGFTRAGLARTVGKAAVGEVKREARNAARRRARRKRAPAPRRAAPPRQPAPARRRAARPGGRPRRRSSKPPSAKQLAARRRFAEMSRARARARRSGG